MANKLWRALTYHLGLPPVKSHGHLITWSTEITWQTKRIISSLTQCLWPPSLEGWWLILGYFYQKVKWSCEITWQNHYISTTIVPMATKLGRVVTYREALLPKMSHRSWVKWFSENTWQIKTIISLLPQCL